MAFDSAHSKAKQKQSHVPLHTTLSTWLATYCCIYWRAIVCAINIIMYMCAAAAEHGIRIFIYIMLCLMAMEVGGARVRGR